MTFDVEFVYQVLKAGEKVKLVSLHLITMGRQTGVVNRADTPFGKKLLILLIYKAFRLSVNMQKKLTAVIDFGEDVLGYAPI